ncbi:MAG: TIGR03086 family metal-binding protein [Acidimicrobiales bacterium]
MTQPLAAAMQATRTVLANVSADQLAKPTPCASWDVAALIDHIIGAQGFFQAAVEGKPPSPPESSPSAGDYLAAYDKATNSCLSAFNVEGVLEGTVKAPFGDMPGMAFMGLAINDTLTHGWDLAKATGQSTDIAPELSAMVLKQVEASFQESFRGEEGAPFGPAKPAPANATNADKLAAFLGRDV